MRIILPILVLLVSALGIAVGDDWPTERHDNARTTERADGPALDKRIPLQQIIDAAGSGQGYCLILGAGSARLAAEIAKQTGLRVELVERDEAVVDDLRRELPINTSNLAADGESLFVAINAGRCLRLDVQAGDTIETYTLSDEPENDAIHWAWIAHDGELLFGSRAEVESGGRKTSEQRSDTVFALDVQSGRPVWSYRGRAIEPGLRKIVVLDAATGDVLWQRPLKFPLRGEGDKRAVYTVRLHFAEPEDTVVGERVFSVEIQGKTVLEDFDVAARAGGVGKSIAISCPGVVVERDLEIRLKASAESSKVPVLCGFQAFSTKGTL